MNGNNAAGRQAGALNPEALCSEDLARLLTASGFRPVTVEMIQADLDDICTVTSDVWTDCAGERPQPWLHYVPIRDDFSDLIEKVESCDHNRDECRQIGQQAKSFFASNSTPEAIWRHVQQRLSP